MTVDLVPILEDNYVFVLRGSQGAVVVDPGEAAPVLRHLERTGLALAGLLLTHHHGDHIGGVAAMLAAFPAAVVVAPERHRDDWPFATVFVAEGNRVTVGGLDFEVLDLPGHTLDHVAYFHRPTASLFSGDVLFGLGCGRVMEGTFEMTWNSLQKLKALPPETRVYCTHEYTEANLAFVRQECPAIPQEPGFNEWLATLEGQRRAGQPSVPLRLGDERRFNPFLRAADVAEFTAMRERRNRFRAPPSGFPRNVRR